MHTRSIGIACARVLLVEIRLVELTLLELVEINRLFVYLKNADVVLCVHS